MRDTTASFISIHSLVVSEALLSLTPPHSVHSAAVGLVIEAVKD